jgi:hypothetical protein
VWDGFFYPGEHFLVKSPGTVRLLAARRLAALVDVLRVARRAPRLLHVFFDHRHDGVIGYASLSRTVVVQNVTETQPALLHYLRPPNCPEDGLRIDALKVFPV